MKIHDVQYMYWDGYVWAYLKDNHNVRASGNSHSEALSNLMKILYGEK